LQIYDNEKLILDDTPMITTANEYSTYIMISYSGYHTITVRVNYQYSDSVGILVGTPYPPSERTWEFPKLFLRPTKDPNVAILEVLYADGSIKTFKVKKVKINIVKSPQSSGNPIIYVRSLTKQTPIDCIANKLILEWFENPEEKLLKEGVITVLSKLLEKSLGKKVPLGELLTATESYYCVLGAYLGDPSVKFRETWIKINDQELWLEVNKEAHIRVISWCYVGGESQLRVTEWKGVITENTDEIQIELPTCNFLCNPNSLDGICPQGCSPCEDLDCCKEELKCPNPAIQNNQCFCPGFSMTPIYCPNFNVETSQNTEKERSQEKIKEIFLLLDAYFNNTPVGSLGRIPTVEDIFNKLDEYFGG